MECREGPKEHCVEWDIKSLITYNRPSMCVRVCVYGWFCSAHQNVLNALWAVVNLFFCVDSPRFPSAPLLLHPAVLLLRLHNREMIWLRWVEWTLNSVATMGPNKDGAFLEKWFHGCVYFTISMAENFQESFRINYTRMTTTQSDLPLAPTPQYARDCAKCSLTDLSVRQYLDWWHVPFFICPFLSTLGCWMRVCVCHVLILIWPNVCANLFSFFVYLKFVFFFAVGWLRDALWILWCMRCVLAHYFGVKATVIYFTLEHQQSIYCSSSIFVIRVW